MILQFVILTVGLIFLWGGAELLIRNSSKFARSLGVSPVIIGLTVVSIGTSLPEFVVSLTAAVRDTMGISIGNIIGSNIANIGLILGVGAIITSLEVKKSYVHKEVPAMLVFTFLFSIFSWSGYVVSRIEGIILFSLLLIFLIYLSRASILQMQDFQEVQKSLGEDAEHVSLGNRMRYLGFSAAGIVMLIGGSRATVDAGVEIAQAIGVSETVIGLTLIAVGTSLPELATTIVGLFHDETDIVVGNVIGSNIFNLLFIGGLVPILHPIPIEASLFYIEFPFLIGLSLLVWPIMRLRWNVHRWEGVILLVLYVFFIGIAFNT